jgi:Flp pilus assembly protein TadG
MTRRLSTTDVRSARSRRGQSLVEFALVLPVFLLLLVAIFDLGHVVWANDALSAAAREAARFAIVHGGSESTACPVGPPAGTATLQAASSDCPFPSPSKQAIKEVAERWLSGTGADVTVSVCYGAVTTCRDDSDAADATNARGTPITVAISARVSLGAPTLLGLGPIGLSTSSTMTVSH